MESNMKIPPKTKIYLKQYNSGFNRDTCTLLFIIIQNSQAMKTGDALQLMNGLRKCVIYTQ
jgi:hypothetical protein